MFLLGNRMGLVTGLLAGIGLLVSASGGAAAGEPAIPGVQERITRADEELSRLTTRLDRLAREISFSVQSEAAKQRWEGELTHSKGWLQATVSALVGLRFADLAEVMQKVSEAERKLAEVAELLRAKGSEFRPAPASAPAVGGAPASGTGAIAGTVTDAATGSPLPGVTVWIFKDWATSVSTTTNEAGQYLVTGLSAGTYFAYTDNDEDYIDEVFANIWCRSLCEYERDRVPISVVENTTTEGIDFALEKFGAITGSVLRLGSGQPVEDATLYLYDANRYFSWAVDDTDVDATGNYHFTRVFPGTYYVFAWSPTHGDELYNGFPCDDGCVPWDDGTPIPVVAGETTTNINFSLPVRGSIAGQITDAVSGSPVPGFVTIFRSDGRFAKSVMSDQNGSYQVDDLPTGTYFARARSSLRHYAEVVFDGLVCAPSCNLLDGTPIAVTNGQVTTDIDFALPRLGAIAGTVRDASSGFPIQTSWVRGWHSDGVLAGYEYVSEFGEYSLPGLMPGAYFVTVSDPYYIDELYDDMVCQPLCNPLLGTPVSVPLNAVVTGVDFDLQLGGGIAGRVVAVTSGDGVEFIRVQALDANGEMLSSALSSEFGNYVIRDLPSGSYFVLARDARYDPLYAAQLYEGIPCEPTCNVASGTPVPVTVSVLTGGINFALDSLGRIAGRVVDATTGNGLRGFVRIYDENGSYLRTGEAYTDGEFVVTSLRAGSYYAVASSFPYASQLFEGMMCDPICDVTNGTPITVSLNSTTAGVNFSLVKRGEIRGTVAEFESGAPLSGWVRFFDSSGQFAGDAWAFNGVFERVNLPAGDYFAVAYTYGGHVGELYSNREFCASCPVTSGTPINVALATVTSGVDFILRKPFFADVGLGHWARRWVDLVFAEGITRGCGGTPQRFCPSEPMTRWQASVWLARAVAGGAVPDSGEVPERGTYHCTAGGVSVFADVPPEDVGCKFIHYLAAQGITRGCGGSHFCPGGLVDRWQLSVLVARSIAQGPIPESGSVPGMGSYSCTAGGNSVFSDVTPTDVGCKFIHFLAAQGVTKGCGGGKFCPASVADRAQTAVFTARAFGFSRYRP